MQRVNSVPQTKPSQKKSWRKNLLENQQSFMERLNEHDRKMKEEIEKQIDERLGDYVHQIESALDGVIALRIIFRKKGYITQEEYNKEKAEMRKKK